jgi:type I restriction enzyme S subunit
VGRHSEALVKEPAVIIGRKGSVGAVHLSKGQSWPIDTAFFALGSKDVDLNFLYYLLKTLPITSNSDSAVPGLNRDFAHSIEIRVPEIRGQVTIGEILANIDTKISANENLSGTLEEIAQTIFKSWFIDFDPVKAKMEGEHATDMDAETASFFPDSMEESELGLIPKGWEVRSLDEISEYLNGLAMQKFPVIDENAQLPVVKIAQLRVGNTQGADMASALLEPKFIIKDGDILFSWSGTLEVENWAGGPGALNQHLFKVTGKTVPDWYSYLSTKSFLSFFRGIASGKATTMGHIQRGHLTESKLAIPNLELMNRATEIIEPIIALKTKTSVESRLLAEIRDSLLPRLISGALQIPEEMLAS